MKCDGCGAMAVIEGSARGIPDGWRRIAVRQRGAENKPDTFDICGPDCAILVVKQTYE